MRASLLLVHWLLASCSVHKQQLEHHNVTVPSTVFGSLYTDNIFVSDRLSKVPFDSVLLLPRPGFWALFTPKRILRVTLFRSTRTGQHNCIRLTMVLPNKHCCSRQKLFRGSGRA